MATRHGSSRADYSSKEATQYSDNGHSATSRPVDLRLDLRTKLHQRTVVRRSRAVFQESRQAGPLVVELDPTTVCDLACPECISTRLLNRGGFSRQRLLTLVEELVAQDVRAVILIGGGEPLLHPVVGEVIERLSEAGIQVGLTTNGTQIQRYLSILARHASWTRVSVDAGTPETFARFRPSRSGREVFMKVIANMRRLAADKNGALGYSYLLMHRLNGSGALVDSNFDEIAGAAALARDIGCDYFEIKPAYDMEHYLVRIPGPLRRSFLTQLSALCDLESSDFSVIYPQHFQDLLDGAPVHQPKAYDVCPVSQLRTLLTPNGAYLCPYHRGNPLAYFGDPSKTSFDALWKGPLRQKALAQMRPSSNCKFHCIRHSSNESLIGLHSASTSAWDAFEESAVDDHDLFI